MTHLVTGATGFVGAALVLELLERTEDEVCCLVRGSDDASATARLHTALTHAAGVYRTPATGEAIAARVRAVAGDVTAAGCGADLASLPRIGQVWHAAASLRFEDRYAAEIHTMNVVGTANLVDLVKALGGPLVNHVSTAYVAGRRTGPIEESVPDGEVPTHNLYERSKVEGERMIARSGLDWRILRPSIVIGHGTTRAATTFSGMYGFVSALLVFRRSVQRHFGHLLGFRPIPLIADPEAELNLVPVDAVAREAVAVGLNGPAGTVFHLTNAASPTVGAAISEIFEGSGLRPPVFVPDGGRFTALDRKLDDAMDFYSSYLAYGKTFDRANTDAVCGGTGAFPLPPGEVGEFVGWYRELIERDGRVTAPARQSFAFRRPSHTTGERE
ncbi:SDR family oxidoreductase [Actinocorallia longicatena]|uniref:Thioester reductase (TE) domain-containing protein n=1 Tax=Actinocorallia longicatena TaxID=111803 RepID=A0ABP6Q4Q2_9ACTN